MSASQIELMTGDLMAVWLDRVGVKGTPQQHVQVFAEFLLAQGWRRTEPTDSEVE